MCSLTGKTILVTGGAGFLGQHLVKKLHEESPKKIVVPRSKTCDLRKIENCQRIVQGVDIVFHLAGDVGGIGYNQKFPGNLFYDNLMMGVQLMESARLAKVEKFISIGTVCSYPKFTPVPFREEDLWNGYPEETNAPYGLAKKMLLVQAQAYRKQYDMNAISLLLVNLYGPGDNFDPASSHVIPALIGKVIEAKKKSQKSIEIWGTGKATREFLYAEEAAKAIVLAAKFYDKAEPLNIGAGFETSIEDLTKTICRLLNYKGEIVWNKSKPDGQPRRCLDVTKAEKEFGFKAKVDFEKGLNEEISWYLKNCQPEGGMTLEEAIKNAGLAAMTYWRSPTNKRISKGKGRFDYYSRADEVSEEIIIDYLKRSYPSDDILSEEFGSRRKRSRSLWVVDPLDGSISFLGGLETWGVSVGHLLDSETREAYLYLPLTDELIIAKKNKGVFLNGKKISSLSKKENITIAADYSKDPAANKKYRVTEKLAAKFLVISYGSTAYSIGSFLAGRIHGFVHPKPDRYDWAGIDLLVREAGGMITTIEGEPINRNKSSSLVCSASPEIHQKILEALNNRSGSLL